MSKKGIIVTFLAFAAVSGFLWHRERVSGLLARLPDRTMLAAQVRSLIPIGQIKKEIITASPLRAYFESQEESNLTIEGIILQTNYFRIQGGEKGLDRNAELDAAAELKLQDMFIRQYFAHTSPARLPDGQAGLGPSYWIEKSNYEYIVIGENLALGDYKDDKTLVSAWMASTGHRENILNPRFQEIGVSVGKGMFEGKATWLAVQIFGKPSSSCPSADAALKIHIDSQEKQLNAWQMEMETLKGKIAESSSQDPEAYNALVDQYNVLAGKYNSLVETAKRLIATYNRQVNQYNACASSL